MKISLIMIGKTEMDYLRTGIALYEKRLIHYIPFSMQVIPDIKNQKNLSTEQIKTKEGESLITSLNTYDSRILLDENGKKYKSKDFAGFVQRKMNQGVKNMAFVIGGAYGFSDDVYNAATEKISLSDMTFSHQMIRLLFVEQLYRAFTIIKNEPYHHE